MARFRSVVPSLLAIGVAGAACGQVGRTDPAARVEVPKVEREGVWQPTAGGTQVPLWPADVALAKPGSGDHREATGYGSPLVGGRTWHWASYVARPTMTLYRPKVLLGLEDAQRAMGLLRQGASAYGIDPHKIGVIGFCAGAYLVANMSNTDDRTYPVADAADRQFPRPDFAIAAYTALATGALKTKPAYGMWGLAHVLLAPLKTRETFASAIERSSLPAAHRIASVILVPIDSYALYAMPQGKTFTPMRLDMFNVTGPLVKMEGPADLAAAAPARQIIVYDLAGRGSPCRTSPDFTRVRTSIGQDFEPADPDSPAMRYVRYLGVVRGSDWAGVRTGPPEKR